MSSEPPAAAEAHREEAAGPRSDGERWRFSRASLNLTAATVVFAAITVITGPILARALGPAGRGDLAAILVPVGIAAAVALLGQDTLGAREAARGRPVGTLIGSLGAVVLATGSVAFIVGIPLAGLLAEGRDTVHTFLLVGFATVPVALLGMLLIGISAGLERWRLVIAARVVPFSIVLLALIALLVADSLTVASAAVVYLSVALTTLLVVAPVLRSRRVRFDRKVARDGAPYAVKAWAGDTADLANVQLDQLLMIALVSSSELGLYVVAASVGKFALFVSAGISPPLMVRVSAGEVSLAPKALRTVLFVLLLATLVVAAAMPFLLSALFGPDFEDAAPAAWILLAAGLPLAGSGILTPTLLGVGRPGLSAAGQAVALLITIPGLFLLIPVMGIEGAALVSLVAYTANFLIQLVATMRICRLSAFDLLVPKRDDLVWLQDFVRTKLRRGAR